jgi:PKD repeat protein
MKKYIISLVVLTFLELNLYAQPTASFTFSPNSPCSGVVANFTNTSSGATSYLWEFGDGSTSTLQNPTHTFTSNSGNGSQQFFVTLTARQGGQRNSSTQAVSVLQPPDPTLIDPTNWPAFSMCSGGTTLNLTVNNGSTTTNTDYIIDWGDGSSNFNGSSLISQPHTYTGIGSYSMIFTVTGANTCVNSKTYEVFIGGNPSLGVSSPGGTTGCAPLALSFDITNTSSNLGTIYKFEFDDGSIADEYTQATLPAAITHIFSEPSCVIPAPNTYFTLTATATNACGVKTITVSPINIDREPTAQISVSPNDTICLGNLVTYNNNTIPPCGGNPALTDYTWVIDGSSISVGTSTASQSYTYPTSGTKTVTLTASNSTILSCHGGLNTASLDIEVIDAAAPPQPVGLTGPTQVCQGEQGVVFTVPLVPNATTYNWTLPSGASILSGQGTNTVTVNFAPNAQTGNVNILVCGANACQTGINSVPYSFTINPLPTPAGDIDGIPSLCQGQAAVETYTVPPITNVDDYVWSVPTGATITGGNGTNTITISFPANATSGNITVYGTNSCGQGTSSFLYVEVKSIPADATTISGPASACEGDEITLTEPAITYADIYVWTMENGSVIISPSNTITHTISGGVDTAIFEVYGGNTCGVGASAQLSIPIYPSPKTNFAPKDHCHGFPAPLVDTSITSDNNIISWQWYFDDGYGSNLAEPNHTFADSGSYNISLTVQSDKGCGSKVDTTITVYPTPEAHHRPIPTRTSIVKPEITFKDSSFYARSWFWNFGDSTTATSRNPVHAYTKTGEFKVMEVAYSGFGCSDTTYSNVVIYEGVYVPNAFLPGGGGGGGGGSGGGDGTSVFKPMFGVAAEKDGFSFMVFNRWGEMVFSTTNADEGWNGLVRNTGSQAPVGIYAWKLTYKQSGTGKIKTRTGNVMLLR